PELDAALLLHARDVVGEHALHRERRAQRALRIVLVRDRCPEDHEDRVADELLDRSVVSDRLFGEVLEDAGHEDLQLLGVHLIGELREAREVGEEDGDESALLELVLHGRPTISRSCLYPSQRSRVRGAAPRARTRISFGHAQSSLGANESSTPWSAIATSIAARERSVCGVAGP